MFSMVVSIGTPLGKPLGRTFTPHAPVSCARFDPLLPDLDLFPPHRRIGRFEFASRAETQQTHFALLESLADLVPLSLVERRFDAVLVPRAQLDGLISRRFQIPDDGFEIPVLQEVVGDAAQVQHGSRHSIFYAVKKS